MISETYLNPVELKKLINDRKVFIWGARHDGYAASLVLKRIGVEQASFIDSSIALQGTKAFGYSISLPDDFFSANKSEEAFIMIASGFYADEISEICVENGFVKQHDFVIYGELRKFNYQVDISGACNLKCISCPRGNYPEHRPRGFMSADTYHLLIEKILADDPYTGIMTLYNWGEPLLNRALPEIIRITNEYSILSAISTNLSFNIDFEPVIQAKPTWFRVSNSGWGENYEITHTGGNWELFYNNLYKLKEYKERHHPEMIVEVFFHIYAHNREDFPKIQELCDNLGFTLRYRHAALAPLDNIEKIFDGYPVSPQAEQTRKIQFLTVEEAMEIAQSEEEKSRPCYYEDHLWINWDLHIAHCMEWYKPGLDLVEKDFLSVSLEELRKARENSTFCKKCKSKGIHRAYCVYGDEKLIAKKQSLIVP